MKSPDLQTQAVAAFQGREAGPQAEPGSGEGPRCRADPAGRLTPHLRPRRTWPWCPPMLGRPHGVPSTLQLPSHGVQAPREPPALGAFGQTPGADPPGHTLPSLSSRDFPAVPKVDSPSHTPTGNAPTTSSSHGLTTRPLGPDPSAAHGCGAR